MTGLFHLFHFALKRSNKNSPTQPMEMKSGTTLWKIVCHSLIKLKINIPHGPVVSLLDIFSRKMHALVHQGTVMFMTALLIIALN